MRKQFGLRTTPCFSATRLAIALSSLIGACGDKPIEETTDPAGGVIETTSQALLGTVTPTTGCDSPRKAFIEKFMRFGRAASASRRFKSCMAKAVQGGKYRQCNGDPFFGESTPVQLAKVLAKTWSTNPLTIACTGGSGNASASLGTYDQKSEKFAFSKWLTDVHASAGPANDPTWPAWQAAGIGFHEVMHQYGYTHGANDQANAIKACGYPGDPTWHYQVNTMPYIVGDCLGEVISSSSICGNIDSCGPNTAFFPSADGSTCECINDPRVDGNAGFNRGNNILWANATARVFSVWQLASHSALASPGKAIDLPLGFFIQGTGDFNKDANDDLLVWQAATGGIEIWTMKGVDKTGVLRVGTADRSWQPASARDFDGDGIADVFFRNNGTGRFLIWYMNANGTRRATIETSMPVGGSFSRAGDFDGDGKTDLLFSAGTAGNFEVWFTDAWDVLGATRISITLPRASATVVGRMAGKRDAIVIHGIDGKVTINNIFRMSASTFTIFDFVPSDWTIVATGDVDGAGRGDILWRHDSGQMAWWAQRFDGTWAMPPVLATVPSPWMPIGTLSDQTF